MNTVHSFEAALDADPLVQFHCWYAEAEAVVEQPDAVVLATATASGRPSARMVLLKHADEDGFGFYTNLESRKASELGTNPHAALLCHWQPLGRQVRVEGGVHLAPARETEEYFRSRPFESRHAAWASPQSRPLADRSELERLYAEATERFPGEDVPLPPHWGGFRLVPEVYEFWQHGAHRLHDRLRYERAGGAWRRQRLAP